MSIKIEKSVCTICENKTFINRQDMVKHIRLHFLTYICSSCNEIIVGNVAYEYHLKERHEPKTETIDIDASKSENGFPCTYCDVKIKQKQNLKRHIQVMHLSKKESQTFSNYYPCMYCDVKLKQKQNLKRHIQVMHESKKESKFIYICDDDQEKFARKKDIVSHFRTKHFCFECDYCHETIRGKRGVMRHMREKHRHFYVRSFNRDPKGPFTCTICGLVVKSLYDHNKFHQEKRYMCNTCGKRFRKMTNLQLHEAIHKNLKLFSCDICFKKFNIQQGLNAHKRTHTRERPYKCPYCENSFRHSTDLRRHRRIHPEHIEEQRFKCEFCNKRFYEKKFLFQHAKSHSHIME